MHYQYSTYFVESSEQIASQRFKEEFLLRIPLKPSGGFGKFGRWKLSISTEFDSCSCVRDWSKSSSEIDANESAEIPRHKELWGRW